VFSIVSVLCFMCVFCFMCALLYVCFALCVHFSSFALFYISIDPIFRYLSHSGYFLFVIQCTVKQNIDNFIIFNLEFRIFIFRKQKAKHKKNKAHIKQNTHKKHNTHTIENIHKAKNNKAATKNKKIGYFNFC
jgi:hypothetical protein